MDIRLTRELEAFIRKRVRSGMYKDRDEVVREALRTLVEQERLRASHVAEMKQKIRAGLRQARQGRFVDGERVVRRWETRLMQLKKRKRA
jgi:putative addiction module CopG family antidote